MATYNEQIERNSKYNEAKRELTLELLKDPNSDRVRELKNIMSDNQPPVYTPPFWHRNCVRP